MRPLGWFCSLLLLALTVPRLDARVVRIEIASRDQKRAANSKVVEMVLPRPVVNAESPEMASQRACGTNGIERESAATPLQFSRSVSSD
jgi:hypothetical protein